MPPPSVGKLELEFEFVIAQLQLRPEPHPRLDVDIVEPPAKLGLDRVASVLGRNEPQHELAVGLNVVVLARRLRLDQPLGVVVIALERKLNRPTMMNAALPARVHLCGIS